MSAVEEQCLGVYPRVIFVDVEGVKDYGRRVIIERLGDSVKGSQNCR